MCDHSRRSEIPTFPGLFVALLTKLQLYLIVILDATKLLHLPDVWSFYCHFTGSHQIPVNISTFFRQVLTVPCLYLYCFDIDRLRGRRVRPTDTDNSLTSAVRISTCFLHSHAMSCMLSECCQVISCTHSAESWILIFEYLWMLSDIPDVFSSVT